MLRRIILTSVACSIALSSIDAAPPWKKEYRAQRDVMRAQFELQKATTQAPAAYYQQQSRHLKQNEKLLRQQMKYGFQPSPYARSSQAPGHTHPPQYTRPTQTQTRPQYRQPPVYLVPNTPYVTVPHRYRSAPSSTAVYQRTPPQQVLRTAPRSTAPPTSNGAAIVRTVPRQPTPMTRTQVPPSAMHSRSMPRESFSSNPPPVQRPVHQAPRTPAFRHEHSRSLVYATPVHTAPSSRTTAPVVRSYHPPTVIQHAPAVVESPSSVVSPSISIVTHEPTTPIRHEVTTVPTSAVAPDVKPTPELIPVPLPESALSELSISSSDDDGPQPTPAKRPAAE